MEPLLEMDDIQGNIEPGFRMPFQKIVAIKLADEKQLAPLLTYLLPMVTTMREAMAYHANRLTMAKASGVFGKKSFDLVAGDQFWLNVSVGKALLDKFRITSPMEADHSFAMGQYQQSRFLGDPTDPTAEGFPGNWKIGSETTQSDVFLVLAADTPQYLEAQSNTIINAMHQKGRFVILYQENAERPADDTEHFGFKDGISQPVLRGLTQLSPLTYYTPRQVKSGNSDPEQPEFAGPGKILIWPGQFIFGYPTQSGTSYRDPGAIQNEPDLRNGSFLVFRRLKQLVKEFYDYTNQQSAILAQSDPQYKNADVLRSKIVGRSKSSAESLLFDAPQAPSLINHFQYGNGLNPMVLQDGTAVESSVNDPLGSMCPFFAHVRKVNPRDVPSNRGSGKTTLALRIMRRGIPFGPQYDHKHPENASNGQERGLLFMSYQTSIREQFEPLVNDWMNSDVNPEGGEGFDLLIGQNNRSGQGRLRTAMLTVNGQDHTLSAMNDFIVPTGGEYLFTPSLSLLKRLSLLQ